MKPYGTKILQRTFAAFCISLLFSGLFSGPFSGTLRAESPEPPPTAADIWTQMERSSLTREPIEILVQGAETNEENNFGRVSFGGEKEASSSIITRVMSPKKEAMNTLVLKNPKRAGFLKEFFKAWATGGYREKEVKNLAGETVPFDMKPFQNVNWDSLSEFELLDKWDTWIEQAGDKSLSFIKSPLRRKLASGDFPGLSEEYCLEQIDYRNWEPLHGFAEKYIDAAHPTGNGWEINFKPQKTYAEQEDSMEWFRKTLHKNGRLFQAPGHQWTVMAKRPKEKMDEQKPKIAELLKNFQAYIYLTGIERKTNIEISRFKEIATDDYMATLPESRGALRTNENTYPGLGVELRAGTKNNPTRRFLQQVLVSRYASGDYEGIANVGDWELIPMDLQVFSYDPAVLEKVAKRFGVSSEVMSKFLEHAGTVGDYKGRKRKMSPIAIVPLWQWENAPYLSPEKKLQIKHLTRNFIEQVANEKSPSLKRVQEAMAAWAKVANLSSHIENYMRPQLGSGISQKDSAKFQPTTQGKIDVNEIDLGIEYTGRYPIHQKLQLVDDPLDPKNKIFVETQYGLTADERKSVLGTVAKDLAKRLAGSGPPLSVQEVANGHGHSIGTTYEVVDREGKKWAVEWDGIGRTYDNEGDIIDGTQRGGHVEIVTPKGIPDPYIDTIFDTLDRHSLLPSEKVGGAHINADLAPFENNPKAMARFIAAFLKHRGVISLMFQDLNRLKSAEPFDVPDRFISTLENFSGTEAELKKFLYENGLFNSRLGRKTQYTQLNLTAYFQDVIPEAFIHEDFDLQNEVWRKNFEVDPKVRKMELRLFNAPRNAHEARLQVKLVRALMHKALNENTPIGGKPQAVDHAGYVKAPNSAFSDLNHLVTDLGLQAKEYEPFVVSGLSRSRDRIESEGYETYAERVAENPKTKGWGKATSARHSENAISSEGRLWQGAPETAALALQQVRQRQREHETQVRKEAPLHQATSILRRQDFTNKIELDAWKSLGTADAFVHIFLHSKEKDPATQEKVTAALEELKSRAFNSEYEAAIKRASASRDREYFHWLAGLFRTHLKNVEGNAVMLMVIDPDPVVAEIGRERFSQGNYSFGKTLDYIAKEFPRRDANPSIQRFKTGAKLIQAKNWKGDLTAEDEVDLERWIKSHEGIEASEWQPLAVNASLPPTLRIEALAKVSEAADEKGWTAAKDIADESPLANRLQTLALAVKDGNRDVRYAALDALSRERNEKSTDILIEALSHPDWDTRLVAMEDLIGFRNRVFSAQQIAKILNQTEPSVSQISTRLSQSEKNRRTKKINALQESLNYLKAQALGSMSLSSTVSSEEARLLIEEGLKQSDPKVQAKAVFQLHQFQDEASADQLRKAALQWNDVIRNSALAGIALRSDRAGLSRKEWETHLEEALRSEDAPTQVAVRGKISDLIKNKDGSAIKLVSKLLLDTRTRGEAMSLLLETPPENRPPFSGPVLKALIKEAKGDSIQAIYLLRDLPLKQLEQLTETYLKRKKSGDILALVAALGERGRDVDYGRAALLAKALKHPDDKIVSEALRGILRVGAITQKIRAMDQALSRSPGPATQTVAAAALRELYSKRAPGINGNLHRILSLASQFPEGKALVQEILRGKSDKLALDILREIAKENPIVLTGGYGARWQAQMREALDSTNPAHKWEAIKALVGSRPRHENFPLYRYFLSSDKFPKEEKRTLWELIWSNGYMLKDFAKGEGAKILAEAVGKGECPTHLTRHGNSQFLRNVLEAALDTRMPAGPFNEILETSHIRPEQVSHLEPLLLRLIQERDLPEGYKIDYEKLVHYFGAVDPAHLLDIAPEILKSPEVKARKALLEVIGLNRWSPEQRQRILPLIRESLSSEESAYAQAGAELLAKFPRAERDAFEKELAQTKIAKVPEPQPGPEPHANPVPEKFHLNSANRQTEPQTPAEPRTTRLEPYVSQVAGSDVIIGVSSATKARCAVLLNRIMRLRR
jgi:HEAT repeat protein